MTARVSLERFRALLSPYRGAAATSRRRAYGWWCRLEYARRAALLLLALAVFFGGVTMGCFSRGRTCSVVFVREFGANVTTDLLFVALAVLVIDTLVRRDADDQRIRDLKAQAGSLSNDFALEAVRLLRLLDRLCGPRGALQGANLRRANLEGAELQRANLNGADLHMVHLEGAELWEAHLEDARLWEAHLEGVDLRRARLEGTGLRSAHLEGVDLWEARLEGADLRWVHLEGAKNIMQQQLDSARSYHGASLPNGLTPDPRPEPEP